MTLSPAAAAALTLALCLAAPLAAQEATAPADPAAAPAPAEGAPATAADLPGDLSMGETANPDGIGSNYVAASFGDWQQRCLRTEDGSDPCQLYQLLQDAEGNSVAEITIFGLPEGSEAAAGATAIVPLGTLLTEGLLLGVDAAEPKRYPFAWCSEVGCVARLGFSAAEVDGLRKGNAASMTIIPVMAPDQKVSLKISLAGFTAGLAAVDAANADGGTAPEAPVPGAPAEGGN
jgi:invasion protein IalB